MMNMLDRKSDVGFEKVDVGTTLLLETGSARCDDWAIFSSSVECQSVVRLVCLTIVENFLYINLATKIWILLWPGLAHTDSTTDPACRTCSPFHG